jgi:peptidoglycan/xylan/chitin deacetylase (PgdA/CDA1 family)
MPRFCKPGSLPLSKRLLEKRKRRSKSFLEAPPAKTSIPHFPRSYSLIVPILKFLGYRFATLSQALAAPAGKFACLTFDGAERELLLSVVPVLETQKVPATLFIDTKVVSQKTPPQSPKTGDTTRLVQYPLSWKTLRHLSSQGWEVGSLGHGFVNLTEKSYLLQKQNIHKSRDVIAKNLGKTPKVFAYPYGAYDATTLSCVRESGFSAAVTLRPEVTNADEAAQISSHYQLPRLSLTGKTWRDCFMVLRQTLKLRRQAPSHPPAPSASEVDASLCRFRS